MLPKDAKSDSALVREWPMWENTKGQGPLLLCQIALTSSKAPSRLRQGHQGLRARAYPARALTVSIKTPK